LGTSEAYFAATAYFGTNSFPLDGKDLKMKDEFKTINDGGRINSGFILTNG
jgi:hypothetical protein